MQYQLQTYDELLEELRQLVKKKKDIDGRYQDKLQQLALEHSAEVNDVVADTEVIKAELSLLRSLGKGDS